MKVLWICGLPRALEEQALGGASLGAQAAWSWILGHLPPPAGLELHIACPVTRGSWTTRTVQWRGAHWHLVRTLPGRSYRGFLLEPLYFRALHQRLKPDLVHGWGTEDAFSIIASALAPQHHVVQVQGIINNYRTYMPPSWRIRYIAMRERITLRRARYVIAESEYSRNAVQPWCGPHASIMVASHPLRPMFLRAPVVTARPKHIIFVGSLTRGKGVEDAVEAFGRAGLRDWRLSIVGRGSDDIIQRLHAAIQRHELSSQVTLVGEYDEETLVQALADTSIFLLPSYMDTGPTALKEALAMGCWPVCYDNSGPRELIHRFKYGTLVQTGDKVALANALRQVATDHPWQETSRQSHAVACVREAFAHATAWRELLRAYAAVNPYATLTSE